MKNASVSVSEHFIGLNYLFFQCKVSGKCRLAVLAPFLCHCKVIWGWWRRVDSLYWSSSSDTCPDTLWTSHLRRDTMRWRWSETFTLSFVTVIFIHGRNLLRSVVKKSLKQLHTAAGFYLNLHHGYKCSLRVLFYSLATPERKVRGSRRGTSPLGNFSQASS